MGPVFRRVVFRGFTLIELAIVLVIVSLMTGFGMKAMETNHGGETKCYDETRTQLRVISGAMDAFVRTHNFYPIPAPVSATGTSTTFGTAMTTTSIGTTVKSDTESGGAQRVVFGALPFTALGLPASYAADCWGNKFIYAVSKELATPAAFTGGAGQITVRTGTLASHSDVTTIGAYVVVSRGENALIACQRNYAGTFDGCFCNSAQSNGTITRIDKENCDYANNVFYSSAFNNGTGAPNYFDDLIIYKEKAATQTRNCVPQDLSWPSATTGPCTGPIGALDSGNQASVTNSTTGYTGTVTALCTAGVISTSSPVCNQQANGTCGTANGTDLSAAPSTNLCAVGNATAVSGSGPYTWSCNGTSSGGNSNCTAYKQCAAGAQTWNTNCTATATLAGHGGTQALTNTAGGYTGTATATCNAGGSGVWALSSNTCSAVSSPCNLPWGGSIANGATATAYLAASPAGTCTSEVRTCTNGTLSGSYTNQSCTAGCLAATQSWLTNCSGPSTAMAAGGSQSVTNTAGGYSGTATASCAAGGTGIVTLSATSCSALCSLPWGGTITVGQNVTAYSSAAPVGTCTSETRSCISGASCAIASVSWSGMLNCSKSTTSTLADGQSEYLTVSTTLKDGGCNAVCSNGTLACDGSEYCDDTGCFTSDALITLADGSTKPIAELKKGDKVRGEKGINTVLTPETHTSSETLYGFNGGPIFVTGAHMFMTSKGWASIDPALTAKESNGKYHPHKLAVGDTLVGEDGKTQVITSIDERTDGKRIQLFNPSLDGDHTYYSNGILVHNSKCSTC